jgi:hypothetical protein
MFVKNLYDKRMNFTRLRLFSPLVYRKHLEARLHLDDPISATSGERIFHFEINPSLALQIEIEDMAVYLGPLLASGEAAPAAPETAPAEPEAAAGSDELLLPAGEYYFTQIREQCAREEFIIMAIETQKEALWHRARLEGTVYFRLLWEDGAAVSQVLRPLGSRV